MKVAEPQLEQWWCPDCQTVLRKPPVRLDEFKRFHSWKCPRPMVAVLVLMRELPAPTPET